MTSLWHLGTTRAFPSSFDGEEYSVCRLQVVPKDAGAMLEGTIRVYHIFTMPFPLAQEFHFVTGDDAILPLARCLVLEEHLAGDLWKWC